MNCILIFQKLSTIKSETLLTLKYIPIALFLSNIDVGGGNLPPMILLLEIRKGVRYMSPVQLFKACSLKTIIPLTLMVRV